MSLLKPLAALAALTVLASACATADDMAGTGMQPGDGGGGTGTTAGVGAQGSTSDRPGSGPPN